MNLHSSPSPADDKFYPETAEYDFIYRPAVTEITGKDRINNKRI